MLCISICTWNVNGIRKLRQFFSRPRVTVKNPDVLCLQETWAATSQEQFSIDDYVAFHADALPSLGPRPVGGVSTYLKIETFQSGRLIRVVSPVWWSLTVRWVREDEPDIFIVPNPGPGAPLTIDLHDGLPGWYDLTTEDLFAQAEPREVAPGSVFLTPSLAHHLRLVSLHMFKHGAWRPLWLCDVAALAEAAGPEFDTAACFGSGTFTRDWTQSALAAARDLLGADVSAVLPGNVQAPPWVLAAILSAWRRPSPWRGELPFGAALKDPKAWLEARWPDPIEAVFKSGALPWPARPRLTQTKHFLKLLGPAMAHFATPGWWARALAQKRRSHVQEASTGE